MEWQLHCILVSLGAITKYYRIGDLNTRNLFSLSSGGWNSEIWLAAWLDSGGGLHMATFLLCPHMTERGTANFLCLVLEEQSCHHEGPTLVTSSKPNYLAYQRLHLYILSHWKLGLKPFNFQGHNSVHSIPVLFLGYLPRISSLKVRIQLECILGKKKPA